MRNFLPKYILEQYRLKNFGGSFTATTLFIDISGFTAMTHKLMRNGKEGAEILTEIINKVFTPSIDAIYDYGGFISTFAGDAFTAIFQDEITNPFMALSSAGKIQNIFNEIGLQDTKFGDFQLSVKIGLSYGKVEWKIIQNPKQNIYYFSGAAINNCVYCEHRCDKGELIIDENLNQKLIRRIINRDINNKYKKFDSVSQNFYDMIKYKEEGYYSIKQVQPIQLEQPIRRSHSIQQDINIINSFVPAPILNMKSQGEFRDIICCFISFRVSKNFEEAISKVVNLTNEYGAYFNKIDTGDKGRIALALFGAPIGKEKLYTRACDFTLALQRLSGQVLSVGLTFGPAFVGIVGSERRCEYTALGMMVNLSVRFASKADWNGIYIDRYIYANIKEKYEIDYKSEQQFKGFAEKIPVYLLKRKKEQIAKSFFEGKMVGRENELQKLQQLFKPIDEGKFGGIVYVEGIAGIGKSRLVNELKEILDESKYNWFYAPCDEILRKSFNPFIRFLKQYFNQSEENNAETNKANFEDKLNTLINLTKDEEIKKELIRTESILGAMLNCHWEGSLYEQLNAKGRYENALYAIKNFIKAESLQKPVIIELEDGYWIDSDSIKLLEVLTNSVDGYPFIIISACRLNDNDTKFDFGLKEVPQQTIILKYLDRDNSCKMIEDKLNGKVSEKLFNIIWEKSEGDPFYIEQIILYLQEHKLIDKNLNLAKAHFEIPTTINSIIISRIDRLSEELKELVKMASVLGREFSVNILSAMLENKPVQNTLDRGEQENIWSPSSEDIYAFRHSLIREGVYQMQLKKRLRELHKLAGDTIKRLYKDNLQSHYADLAIHYEKAEIKDKAIEYIEKAGDYAKENYQNELAIGFYDKLLSIISTNILPGEEGDKKHIDLLLKKGEVLQLIGKWREAEEFFLKSLYISENLKNKSRIGKSNGNLGWQFYLNGNYDKAMSCYEVDLKISEEMENKKEVSRVLGNMGTIYWRKGDLDKAMQCYERKLDIDEELVNKEGISTAIGNMGLVYQKKSEYDKAIECYEKDLKISQELGNKRRISIAFGHLGYFYSEIGNNEKAMEYNKKASDIAKELGLKYYLLSI